MRTFLSFLVILTFAIRLSAADTNAPARPKARVSAPVKISAGEAEKHYDEEMIVTGKVAQVTIRPKVTFLNIDKAFPNSPFTVVIFHGQSSYFGDVNALKGKAIEIRGKIKKFNDRPEIALNDTNQLTVLESPEPARVPDKTPAAAPATNAPTPSADTNSFPDIM
jgi:DNA/RNA endonuclease YhcR with UshA esterase domain